MRRWMRTICAVGVCVFVVVGNGRNARAGGMPVVDPINLVENAMSAVADVESAIQQVMTVKRQLEQLKQMKKDLEQLKVGDLRELQQSFRTLQSVYRRGKQISMRWKRIGEQYDERYESYDPKKDDRQTYYKKRRQWEQQTDQSIRSAMKTHGVVEEFESREKALQELVDKSDNAEGTLAAIQAGNRITALMARQLQELTGVIVADSRARLSHIKEQQEKRKASRKRRKKKLMEGYGESKSYEEPPARWPRIE